MFDFVDAYNHAFEAAAREHSMSMAHACVLGRVGTRRGMGELAEELGCDASNITQIVTRLEGRSLVRREPNPEDRRFRQIVRTPAGDVVNDAFEESFDFPAARSTASPTRNSSSSPPCSTRPWPRRGPRPEQHSARAADGSNRPVAGRESGPTCLLNSIDTYLPGEGKIIARRTV